MKKKRGLRRYFRNLGDDKCLKNIDFSGAEDSWFDLYHIHIDNTRLGNRSWKSRKQHLDALFALAQKVEMKLIGFPKEFQFWIEIYENDSFDDAIYIHTQNPNRSEFPVKIDIEEGVEIKRTKLEDFIQSRGFIVMRKKVYDENGREGLGYFLQKEKFGVSIYEN